jgi:hypothetical protein
MSYSINDTTMISGSTTDTITLTSTSLSDSDSISPTYTIGNISGTANISSGMYWGLNSGLGNAGQVLTINGNSTGWGNISLAEPDIKGATLSVKGDADFEGDITIKGKSLTEMLDKIEERLAILHPNEKLEEKWDELKELGKRYKELEAEIIEKEKVWSILKR